MLKLNYYKNKKVLITGHAGFKGAWLSLALKTLGAKIYGVSKEIKTKPSFYIEIKNIFIKSIFMDIYDYKKLEIIIKRIKPDFIFHLAGQSLVIDSYNEPLNTFKTNTMGTINILNILKELNLKTTAIFITSDKVYDNQNQNKKFVESDKLGINDPYSASKTLAEYAINLYFKTFLKKKSSKIRIGIARAGNVIGGGDWNDNRLIPDCIKSWVKNKKVVIRNKNSTRPWQHVLEPIFGYLIFALNIKKSILNNGQALNFGPMQDQNYKVGEIIKLLSKRWGRGQYNFKKTDDYYESILLSLNIKKAKKIIDWSPVLEVKKTINLTIDWYKCYYFSRKNILTLSKAQIFEYLQIVNKKNEKYKNKKIRSRI
ncbi:CDP-glucose 4,6-dehydratase [Pelagibacteraceae bacterium]|jgi:CDP-glucose 4,6-dehydratase|nr:CDP-glucose 4,6-dehydratase [Pelagibacteraceae bacterium]